MTFIARTKPDTKVEILESKRPHISIDTDALTKMKLYVDECADEIGWLGTAYKDEENNIIFVEDVYLFDQEVHATTTEITPEGLSEFAEELLSGGQEGIDTWNNLKVWGHSHVNMGVSPSSQDDSQMETFKEGGHDWFIRIIANKKGDLKVDLYNYSEGIIYLDLPWSECPTEEEEEIIQKINELYELLKQKGDEKTEAYKAVIKADMTAKVRKKVYKMPTTSTYSQLNLYNERKWDRAYGSQYYDDGGWGDEAQYIINEFANDDEVLAEFTVHELRYLKSFEDLKELEDEIFTMGHTVMLTDDDLERVLRVAIKHTGGK